MHPVRELLLSGAVDVFVKPGEPSMTVISDRPDDVLTEFRGGTLTISTRPTAMFVDGCVHIDGDVTIVNGCMLQIANGRVGNVAGGDIILSGAGPRARVEVTLKGLSSVTLSGSGNLYLEDLNQDEIELELSGAGDITLTGRVRHLSAVISGAADVKAKKLEAATATLKVSGSGDIKARVTDAIKARVSGSGDIKVWGNPAQRDTRVSGSGDIRFK